MQRRGFTLIEILVVIAIIGLLLLIGLPAIQASRESGRRVDCLNRLKQIGVGLALHHSSQGTFPAGQLPDPSSEIQSPWAFGPVSIHTQLLPYMEQQALFHSINFQLDPHNSTSHAQVFQANENRTAASTSLANFICPTDGFRSSAGNSYRGCVGPFPSENDDAFAPGGGHGAFPGMFRTSQETFRDGLSQTVGFSERLQGSGEVNGFRTDRDIWFSGAMNIKRLPDRDAMMRACQVLNTARPPSWNQAGSTWIRGDYVDTLYNQVAPPNWNASDCSANLASGTPGDIATGAISARSLHRGGVHCLYMDGSVKFTSETINLGPWRALASRDGGEALSP